MKEFIYEENVPGTYYVNDECIACDTCTDIADSFFALTQDYDHAYVCAQPQAKPDEQLCEEALEACPVAAIRKRS